MVIVLNIHNVVDGDHYDFYNHNDGWNVHDVCHGTYHDDDGVCDDDGTYDDDHDDDDDVCYKSNHTRKNNHNCKSNHNYKNNHNDLDNNSCSGCKLDHDQTDIDYKIYHDCIHFDCTSCKSDGDSNNGPYIVIL